MNARILTAAAVACLVGCRPQPAPLIPGEPPPGSGHAGPLRAERSGDTAAARASNTFSLRLYHRLARRPGNQLVSPASVWAGIAVVRAGARGETAAQITRVLHLPDGRDDLRAAYAAHSRSLNAEGRDGSYQIRLGSALWVQDGYPLLETFRVALRDGYDLGDTRVDFVKHRQEACRAINDWTASRTGGKIAGIVRAEDLPGPTRLVLITALYLRASWETPFPKEGTQPAPFHVGSGKTVDVPTMNDHSFSAIHGYLDGESFQALAVPCGSRGELSFVVLLPKRVDGLAELEASLSPDLVDSWWPRFRRYGEILIALPKFRLRASLALDALLSDLGMPLAFQSSADFSGINGRRSDLFLAAVTHGARLDVDEEGIEGAAATGFIDASSFGDEPPVFRADHPFIFLVRDTRTGCILFMGRVENPLDEG